MKKMETINFTIKMQIIGIYQNKELIRLHSKILVG